MPIYEYECRACGRQFQRLVLNRKEASDPACPGCGGTRVRKLISMTAYHVSERDRIDAYDPKTAARDERFFRDSRNIGLHARKRAREMGVDLGERFETKLEKLRTDPGSILRDGE